MFFYASSGAVDPALLAYIASNGGRNDIVMVPMWTGQSAKVRTVCMLLHQVALQTHYHEHQKVGHAAQLDCSVLMTVDH